MSVQLARPEGKPEAKFDYWHRHTSTVLSVTTVKTDSSCHWCVKIGDEGWCRVQ